MPGGGLRPSIDFSGGTLWEFQFPGRQTSDLNTDELTNLFAQQGFEGAKVQISEVSTQGQTFPPCWYAPNRSTRTAAKSSSARS
ncbi:MAG: hypothetical protein U0Z44_06970 [Kouleothrix sp.]